MPSLSDLLSTPIDWTRAATEPEMQDLLGELQANILKGHGRHHTGHVFLSFQGMAPAAVAALVRTLGRACTSAYAQLRTNKRYPPYLDGGVVRCMFLSARGYKALGVTPPAGEAFGAGMAARQSVLHDPARADWDPAGWREQAPDAMFLVADADANAVTRDLSGWLNGTGARILVIERGLQQTRQFRPGGDAEGVEHFGYVDGRSQPLFLTEDIAREAQDVAAETADPVHPGAPKWDFRFNPSQFIVADPHGRRPHSAGSYFVFRKLEQDVRGFNAAEEALGHALFGAAATPEQLDRAGAMVVGRFEDGTPLVASATGVAQAVPNGFTYDGDPKGSRCPFHAHIRKTNPRGDVARNIPGVPASADRAPIMARRGITYGAKRPMSADGSEFDDAGREPVHDSGLLFMAYMADLEAQFEFTQQSWANNPDFVRPGTGSDPVMGQSDTASAHLHTYLDGHTPGATPSQHSFANFVHMRGGEYFFAPSLSFLRGMGL
jgi:Dyp-type peroxidase family